MTDREQIKNYIKNYFHPYFDITLASSDAIDSTEPINFIIPIQYTNQYKNPYFTHNKPENLEVAGAILSRYESTDIRREYKCKCTDVTDGDTLKVDILQKITDDNETITYTQPENIKVRLVGINTPEKDKQGYNTSKKFLEKLCKDKYIYLNVDNKTPVDKYGRTLAVVILENKNVNQILLKEGFAEIMYVPPSEFNPFDWDINAPVTFISDPTNYFSEVMPKILPYINNEYTNIVFTDKDNYDVIHRFEAYKGVIYLKLYPYNKNIQMHILPKSYDGSSSLLLFKDEIITNDNITFNGKYNTKSFPPINAVINTDIGTSLSTYEMEYDISKSTKELEALQINIGYSYPSDTTKVFHITGIKDETNPIRENRLAFLDANYDNNTSISNNIAQPFIPQNQNPEHNIFYPSLPTALSSVKSDENVNINHLAKLSDGSPIIFHKTIKYINDNIYIYEESKKLEKEWGETNG